MLWIKERKGIESDWLVLEKLCRKGWSRQLFSEDNIYADTEGHPSPCIQALSTHPLATSWQPLGPRQCMLIFSTNLILPVLPHLFKGKSPVVLNVEPSNCVRDWYIQEKSDISRPGMKQARREGIGDEVQRKAGARTQGFLGRAEQYVFSQYSGNLWIWA